MAHRLTRQELTQRLRGSAPANMARRRLRKLDGPELRTARSLLRATRAGDIDVVYLGDSTNYGFDTAGDTRPVAEMLQADLGPGRRVLPVAAGGYQAAIWLAYLELLAAAEVRPTIVLSLCVRTALDPWRFHPAYHFTLQIERLRTLRPGTSPVRIHQRVPRRSAWEFALHEKLPHRTLLGDLTVGDHIRMIRSLPPGSRERARWLYSYHHGADLRHATTGLDTVRDLGAFLATTGWPVVAYTAPVCVERGTELLGPQFLPLLERNVDLLVSTFTEAAGDAVTVLPTATAFVSGDFVDPDDATEHLAAPGRMVLAGQIRDALVRDAPVRGAPVRDAPVRDAPVRAV